jgi:hypothetical protein
VTNELILPLLKLQRRFALPETLCRRGGDQVGADFPGRVISTGSVKVDYSSANP